MRRSYIALLLLLIFHLLILSKLKFTAWPEMLSFPYLLNHGFITYKDMIHAYPPLLINLLAILYKIFGYNIWVLKFFGWTGILLSDFFVYLILRKLTKKESLPLFGVLVYVILQPVLEGNMVWPDLFIVPFLLFSYLMLLDKKYFWAGLSIGFSVLVKQTGVLFLGIAGLYLIHERKSRNIINFVSGILIATIPFLLVLLKQKTINEFINWTIIYPSQSWTKFPGYVQLFPTIRENLILLILFIPLSFLLIKSLRKKTEDKTIYLLLGFFICGAIGVYPRFSFFHFQTGLAFLVILIFYLLKNFQGKFSYLIFLIPIFILIINLKSMQFGGVRFWAPSDINLAKTIQEDTPRTKPIYLLGLNSNLYALSDRLPNKPWLDNFGWYLEIYGVQQEVIRSFSENPPSKVFWATPSAGNWYDIGTYQPQMITEYIVKNYTKTKEIQKGMWEWTRN